MQYSDGEPADDSDYDTDLEYEEPREEYDPTGDQQNTYSAWQLKGLFKVNS